MSLLDALVDAQAKAAGWRAPQRETRLTPERRWRLDYFWLGWNERPPVALEVEGGAWTNGRHTRGAGFIKDMEKYNTAAALGIRLIRLTPQQVKNGELEQWLRKIAG